MSSLASARYDRAAEALGDDGSWARNASISSTTVTLSPVAKRRATHRSSFTHESSKTMQFVLPPDRLTFNAGEAQPIDQVRAGLAVEGYLTSNRRLTSRSSDT